MSRAEAIFPALIVAVVATLLALGNFVFEYSWTTFAFPLAAGIVLCALCALEITGVLVTRHEAPAIAAQTGEDRPPLALASLTWMFALAVFLYALGFVAGPALYLLAFLRANRFSWVLSASIALASIAVTWGLFIHVIGILLPVEPLWWSQ
jgi:hypothetical protein